MICGAKSPARFAYCPALELVGKLARREILRAQDAHQVLVKFQHEACDVVAHGVDIEGRLRPVCIEPIHALMKLWLMGPSVDARRGNVTNIS
ncbi:hypothetical protein D7Y27_36810 [Corallococcus sp. AB004]|nr:hypothetical protein D7Y27_36810 [Corallococcus sp. AB004]